MSVCGTKPFRFAIIDAHTMRIHNGPLVSWVATATELKPGELIRFRYEGNWIGDACWIISSTSIGDIGENTGGTTVEFRIDLEPQPLWMKMLHKVMDLGKFHSHQMQEVLQALGHRVSHVVEMPSIV